MNRRDKQHMLGLGLILISFFALGYGIGTETSEHQYARYDHARNISITNNIYETISSSKCYFELYSSGTVGFFIPVYNFKDPEFGNEDSNCAILERVCARKNSTSFPCRWINSNTCECGNSLE